MKRKVWVTSPVSYVMVGIQEQDDVLMILGGNDDLAHVQKL